MDDDSVIDKGWDALPAYANKSGEADDAVTVSLSTTPGEWLVNTNDAVVVPMSMAEVVEALQKRKLTERSLVWRAGMQEWAPVDKVPQLKLAARLPIEPTPSVPPPPQSVAPRPTLSTRPPPKPVRSSSPNAAASVPAPSTPPPAVSLPSRKATLPFGLPSNNAASRPANARPSSSPRATSTPQPSVAPPSTEDTGVLAVYSRPAATISFDLSPEKPLQAEAVAPTTPQRHPQTLAPLTSDSAPRRMAAAPNADLSVVAAAHFRQAQKSSKRLVVVSSLVSAAAASLLTFWAHNSSAPSVAPTTAAAPVAAATLAPPEPPKVEPPPAVAAPEVSPPEAPAAAAALPTASPKPKAHKAARPTKLASVAVKATTEDGAVASNQPSAEPNPYDVKLEEDAPKAKPKATTEVTHGSGLDDSKPSDAATASGATTPGF